MATSSNELLEVYQRKIQKALKHFEYSHNKVLSLAVRKLGEEEDLAGFFERLKLEAPRLTALKNIL